MEYGIVLAHKHKEKEYLFRTNYTKQKIEMIYKLDPEEYAEMMREVEEEFLENQGFNSRDLRDDIESYKETGYIVIDSRNIDTEDVDKWSEQRKQNIEEMSREHYEEEKMIEEYGY